MTDPKLFKIFLSSPGDVPEERNAAQEAIEEIAATGEFDNTFILKLYRWDDPDVAIPMPVTNTPQTSVDIYMTRPSQCDLVVVLFWSRMGSPLVMDERDYLSGTHYEYSEALQGYERNKRPAVWLYRCLAEPTISMLDEDAEAKLAQFKRVQQFFKQFQDAEGRYTGGVNMYPQHADFKKLFKGQLLKYLRHLRDNDQPDGEEAPEGVKPKNPRFEGVPYRGLEALDEGDAAIFFGRDAAVLDVMGRIDSKRMVFVLGASGSGKSSLVAAGILPKLRKKGWRIIRCTPGDDPFLSFAFALVEQIEECGVKEADRLKEARKIADELRDQPYRLVQKLNERLPGEKVLLFIDQFEEVFTLAQRNEAIRHDDRDDIAVFMEAIRYIPREAAAKAAGEDAPDDPDTADVTTIITMRADFYGAALPYFKELITEAYGLQKPSMFSLLDLITRPAELAGIEIEDGLARQIVEEVGDQSGALALIAYMMEALYKRTIERGDNQMTREDYQKLGGVQGVINKLASEAYAKLDFDEVTRRQAMRTVFRELVTITEENGQSIPTRRPAWLDSFDDEARAFIEAFVQARLLVPFKETVEVAHEAMFRYWKELKDWIDGVKGDIAIMRQFERDAHIWADPERDMPFPRHELLVFFYRAIENLGYEHDDLDEPLKSFTIPEQTRHLEELDALSPEDEDVHSTRRDIGDRLHVIGDTRYGVGVDAEGIPEIDWLPVEASRGEVEFTTNVGHGFGRYTVRPFFVARYLVTFAQYRAFHTSAEYDNHNIWEDLTKLPLPRQSCRYDNAPRDGLSWYHSVAFANWLNLKMAGWEFEHPAGVLTVGKNAMIRLPAEWEWQWVMQNGAEKRKYAWGGTHWQDGYSNTRNAGLKRSIAVGMYPQDTTACGAMDMSGNLREWCQNDYNNPGDLNNFGSNAEKAVRGGSYANDPVHMSRSNTRYKKAPRETGDPHFGMRLVLAMTD